MAWIGIKVLPVLLAAAVPCRAAETMTIGPLPISVAISGVAIPLPATAALRMETLADHVTANVRLSLPLDAIATHASAIASATGLAKGSCDDGQPLAVSVDGGQLTPAEPDLQIALSGSVRVWLCKPIKTALSPTVPAVLRGTVAVSVAERHTIGLDLREVRIEIPDVSRLGPARGLAEGKLKSLSDKLQADLRRDLAAKKLVLDDLLAPATVSKAEAKFVGTALVIEIEGSLSQAQATTLLADFTKKAHAP